MKINYNDSFYVQHKYRTGTRGEVNSFNDTKWVDINERYEKLRNVTSELLNEQPFNVVGNNKGFEKLINLIGRSNYTFDDIDKSLIETYKVSLSNMMTRNIVNTHAIMFSCDTTSANVSLDKYSNYHIIDAPFNQLHFGERDEFIRQELHKMHNTNDDYYMPISEFYNSKISSLLGFAIICTANGFICNDCMVAIDDKGFKFKMRWGYSSDVKFVIYKLDVTSIHQYKIPAIQINGGVIPKSALTDFNKSNIGRKCLINIHNSEFVNNISSVPNFGEFTDKGFVIKNIQNKTLADINHASTVNITIYELSYLHEVPNVYPAINYYDIIESSPIVDNDYNNIVDVNDNIVIGAKGSISNNTEVCTPPIILDRSTNLSFTTILSCLSMYDDLMSLEPTFKAVGNVINMSNLTYQTFVDKVKIPLNDVYTVLLSLYNSYIKGSILTSLVPYKSIDRFKTLIDSIDNMRNVNDVKNIQQYTIDEYYDENYKFFVDAITLPFRNEKLSKFSNLVSISNNYFDDEVNCFNRPVSEQSFISLKYNNDQGCWLFDLPTINHFKGIGNTFYVNENLNGDEVFKFFVLYTDTDNPSETTVEPFDIDTVCDFDKFSEEVDKHIGYVRYWYAENKLMKLSKILYNKYDEETCAHVLLKILKRKVDGNDLIDVYPSDINYELSNVSSDNVLFYDEDTDRAPFAINFLFYTLSMLNDNEDKLQSYFYHKLTDAKFENRYVDVDVSESIVSNNKVVYPMNYSKFSVAPNTLDLLASHFPVDKTICGFYGLPIISNGDGSVLTPNMYRYTFNVYNNDCKHFLLTHNSIDENYYVKFNNVTQNGNTVYSYYCDIHMGKLVTLYLNYIYDYISELQTNYKTTYNQISLIDSAIESISKIVNDINSYKQSTDTHLTHLNSNAIINSIVTDNIVISTLNEIKTSLISITTCYVLNKPTSIVEYINRILSMIHSVYVTTGFDNASLKRIQKLYNHLKKINTKMNLYSFKKWLIGIDLQMILLLDKVLAKNENYSLSSKVFTSHYVTLAGYVASTKTKIDNLITLLGTIDTTIQVNHIKPITEYCDDIINDYIFDLFKLDNIEYNNALTYITQPTLLKITLPNDSHFNPSIGQQITGDVTMIFQPITEKIGNSYIIKSISNICNYTFFNDVKLSNCNMVVMNDNADIITTISTNLSFKKINSTADKMEDFNQLIDLYKSSIEFQSTHESFSMSGNNMIANDSYTNMNYEMLIGNHFTQLECVHEKVLDLTTMLPGPVDKIYISNQMINDIMNDSFKDIKAHVYFKPSQIFHSVIDLNNENLLNSVGGKYFVGQTIYLSTDDGLITFPATITCIDHSINKGFVEAKVSNSKWFEVNDKTLITKYLTTNITCNVVDDNIRNFLDEFNNSSYSNFTNSWLNTDINYDEYSLPGDPIFVSNNSSYVYTRLNWFFNELVPNRFIDDEHKKYKFIYIGNGFINDMNDDIKIKMINHNFNELTTPEIYPILREEPNDLTVFDEEIATFKHEKAESEVKMANINRTIIYMTAALKNIMTEYNRQALLNQIESAKCKLQYEVNFQKRMEAYITQLEPPTTWYNVRAYDDALVYISNGRAVTSPSLVNNINDIPFTDDLKVFIYDWEHKTWLNPNMYTTSINLVDSVKMYECDDYTTNKVLHSITIKPNTGFILSKQLLIYFSYDKSDVFNDIAMNPYSCSCRFKPLLSIDKPNEAKELYSDIRIRKHFNGFEEYVFDGYNKPDDFSIDNCFYLKRPVHNGKYVYAPTIRMCDMSMIHDSISYDYTKFDLYIRSPFKDVSTKQQFKVQTFSVTINKAIESFTPNKLIKLICVQNNNNSSFNGNISNVMFECSTSLVESVPTLTVLNSSLPQTVKGNFICTVYKDNSHNMSSGVITVNINLNEEMLFDNNWVRIPSNIVMYKELPSECIFVPHEDVVMSTNKQSRIFFNNKYIKASDDLIRQDNSLLNPFEYYYDTINKTRLPISNTKHNTYKERMVIDTTLNSDIKVIKSTYISICRYSLRVIPSNGFIDVTGYVPTPLSRKRYEVWVNGRCINANDIIITSPTSFQLRNLTSLRNLELIELVDDLYNNELMKLGNVYVDLNGKTFSSYYRAFLSNSNIVSQDVKFAYNTNVSNYVSPLISNPNNKNIENDILSNVKFSDETDYDKFINVPSINGIPVYNSSTTLMGIYEIPNDNIIKSFDKTWMHERLTNPYFSITHEEDYQQYEMVTLKQRQSNLVDFFKVYSSGISDMYFSLYVSNKSDGKIDDVVNTLCIIPFIKVGMFVLINKSYKGKWLHTTNSNSNIIRLK